MTAAVIELDDYRNCWTYGWARCRSCDRVWMAVCHMERTDQLECTCGAWDGYVYDETPDEATK